MYSFVSSLIVQSFRQCSANRNTQPQARHSMANVIASGANLLACPHGHANDREPSMLRFIGMMRAITLISLAPCGGYRLIPAGLRGDVPQGGLQWPG